MWPRLRAIISPVTLSKKLDDRSSLMNEWNIQSRAHACELCGQPFTNKQKFHTLLLDDRGVFQRQDICQACWEKEGGPAVRDRKGFVSLWQSVYEAPPPVTDPIQRETAETLLRKLIEANDPKHIPAGYILAVMLERKRVLKVKEQIQREGKRVFIYEQPKTGDLFTIADPDLKLDQLEQVQRDVAQLLEHGLNPPATPAAPASESTPAAPADPATPETEPSLAQNPN